MAGGGNFGSWFNKARSGRKGDDSPIPSQNANDVLGGSEKESSKTDASHTDLFQMNPTPRNASAADFDEGAHEVKEKMADLLIKYNNLKIVNELGQLVTASLNMEDVFQHLYETINSIMDASVFELGIYTWKDNRWKILSNEKYDGNVDYRNQFAEWALRNNREVILDNAPQDYERYVFEPLVLPDGRTPLSLLSFPIYRDNQEVGAISVMSFKQNAFNEYHLDMIRSLIPYTAVAIGNALIHQELILTQNQLVHNEKMASLGQLASGIAHEILNPLNFVNNFSMLSKELVPEIYHTESIEEQNELKDELLSNLDKIYFHGQRAYGIVKNMMMLSRTGSGQATKININTSLTDLLEIAVNGFKSKVHDFDCNIEKQFELKMPQLSIVAEDFGSVMLNVVNNAFYSMNEKRKKLNALPDHAQLVIYEPKLVIKTAVTNGYFVITVKDNGMGIPEEIRSKIFLPFFTTKPTGEGTGLGLSIGHDIITKGNKGEFTVSSEVGKGSEFKICIPVTPAA